MNTPRTRWGALLVGAVEGLLILRLVALVLAARPSNPVVQAILLATSPLTFPLAWLDRWAGQPRFGARLELATLAALVLVALVALAVCWQTARRSHGRRAV